MTDHPVAEMFTGIFGSDPDKRVDGGCDDCDAYQTMRPEPDMPRVFRMAIHHDEACPTLARHNERRTDAMKKRTTE